MYSHVVVCGRLVSDLVLRTNQQSEQKFCLFTVAVNEYNYYSKMRTTHYINCIASGRNAENMARFLKKGALILVEGGLKSRLITGENAMRINSLTVRANNVIFLESKKTSSYSQQAPDPSFENTASNSAKTAASTASKPTSETDRSFEKTASKPTSESANQTDQQTEEEIDWE